MQEKIDVVIIWVNDSDEEWLKKKKQYEKKILNKQSIDNSKKRYRDWENLKYIFRGIEKFMPWVNNVFLITDNQVPEWINKNYSKLRLINHEDYIPKECLPTYNSQAIELNFHRIKKLEEKFIYFNDDMFVINKTKKENFFKNGLPCENAILNPITPTDSKVVHSWYNNTALINKYFNPKETIKNNFTKFINIRNGIDNFRTLFCMNYKKFLGFKFTHIPTSMLKSTFNEVWKKEYEKLYACTNNKFRQDNDYNQYLIKDWQIASGKFEYRSKNFGKVFEIRNKGNLEKVKNVILKQKYKMICVNDEIDNDADFEYIKKEINAAFEQILSEKSNFEK